MKVTIRGTLAIVELCRLRISFLLLARLSHSCGVVFPWLLMWFSKLIIVHFPWLPIFLWEMWTYLCQNILLMETVQSTKIIMPWLEMLLLESFLMISYTVPGKKSAVLGLSGYYQLQCIVANTLPSRKCFQKFRFAISEAKSLLFSFWGLLGRIFSCLVLVTYSSWFKCHHWKWYRRGVFCF